MLQTKPLPRFGKKRFWPHIWPQPDPEQVEITEVRVSKRISTGAKPCKRIRKDRKNLPESLWDQDAASSSLATRTIKAAVFVRKQRLFGLLRRFCSNHRWQASVDSFLISNALSLIIAYQSLIQKLFLPHVLLSAKRRKVSLPHRNQDNPKWISYMLGSTASLTLQPGYPRNHQIFLSLLTERKCYVSHCPSAHRKNCILVTKLLWRRGPLPC